MSGSGTLILAGANSFTGPTSINGGVLGLANNNALSATTQISFGGGTLKYIGNTTDYSTQIVSSTGAVSIDTANQTVEFQNPLVASNTGGLTVLSSRAVACWFWMAPRAIQVLLRLIPAPPCPWRWSGRQRCHH